MSTSSSAVVRGRMEATPERRRAPIERSTVAARSPAIRNARRQLQLVFSSSRAGSCPLPYALCCASPSSKWPPSMTDYSLTRTPSGCCHPLALACQAGPELVCRLRAVDANQHDNYTHIEASFENADVVSLALSSFRVLPGDSLSRPSLNQQARVCRLELSFASSQRPAQH